MDGRGGGHLETVMNREGLDPEGLLECGGGGKRAGGHSWLVLPPSVLSFYWPDHLET